MSRSFVNSWKTAEGLGFAEPSSYGGKGDFGRPFLFVRLQIPKRSPEQMRAQKL